VERFDAVGKAWIVQAQNLRLRTDGWWSADWKPETAFHFCEADGRTYLAKRWPSRMVMSAMIIAERVESRDPLGPFWAGLRGRQWLLVNEPLDGGMFDRSARLAFQTLPGADHVLFVIGPGFHPVDTRPGPDGGGLVLRLPGYAGRDQNEPEPLLVGDEVWVQYGSRLYRPLETIRPLPNGQTRVDFGDGGRLEWRLVPCPAVLTLRGVVAWKVFDGQLRVLGSGRGAGSVTLPQGDDCFLAVQGEAGAGGIIQASSPGR
jgi:hypothetical protein